MKKFFKGVLTFLLLVAFYCNTSLAGKNSKPPCKEEKPKCFQNSKRKVEVTGVKKESRYSIPSEQTLTPSYKILRVVSTGDMEKLNDCELLLLLKIS